ncbi:MAG: hypothetical protein HQL40_06045 [Alphaproteobacteria bacterium]|nr:hypothetical protein [Alphaproteobacteria bacterium]
MVRHPAALALPILLAACQGPMVTQADGHWLRVPAWYQYYAAGKTLPVEVHGQPLGFADEAAERRFADTLRVPPGYAPTRFVPAGRGDQRGFRVVYVFGAPPGMTGDRACRAPRSATLGGPRAAGVVVQGALCLDDDAVSEARGGLVEADPAAVTRLAQLVLWELMPSDSRIRASERDAGVFPD